MSQVGQPVVAVAGGATTGIGLSPGRDDELAGGDGFSRGMNDEAGRGDFDSVDGAFQSQGRPRSMQAIDEGLLDIESAVACGEDFASRLDFGGDPLVMKELDDIARTKDGERVAKKSAGRPNACMMPTASVSWVMLQRVPPDIRIFTPGLEFFSSKRVRKPRSAARVAARRPAAPAPMTTTSTESNWSQAARLLGKGNMPLAMLGSAPLCWRTTTLLHPLEEEILNVEIDDKKHQCQDASETDAGDGFEDSFIGLSAEDSLVEEKNHVPTVEDRYGQEVDNGEVDVD